MLETVSESGLAYVNLSTPLTTLLDYSEGGGGADLQRLNWSV